MSARTACLPVTARFWLLFAALYNIKYLPWYEGKREANQLATQIQEGGQGRRSRATSFPALIILPQFLDLSLQASSSCLVPTSSPLPNSISNWFWSRGCHSKFRPFPPLILDYYQVSLRVSPGQSNFRVIFSTRRYLGHREGANSNLNHMKVSGGHAWALRGHTQVCPEPGRSQMPFLTISLDKGGALLLCPLRRAPRVSIIAQLPASPVCENSPGTKENSSLSRPQHQWKTSLVFTFQLAFWT